MEKIKSDKVEEQIEQEKRLSACLARIKNKFIVFSGKGGVGKTTVAVNLACDLAMRGYQVGILDVDIHGPNIAKMLGISDRRLMGTDKGIEPILALPNLKAVSLALLGNSKDQPVIWRGPLKAITIRQFLTDVNWGDLDYLIIDSPPGTGDEPLSVCQLIKDINGALVVTTPQEVAILDSRKAICFAKELKVPFIGIVENMSGLICPYCGGKIDLFGKGGGQAAADDLKVPLLGQIPLDVEMVSYGDSGKPFIGQRKNSEAAQAIKKVTDRIISLGSGKK